MFKNLYLMNINHSNLIKNFSPFLQFIIGGGKYLKGIITLRGNTLFIVFYFEFLCQSFASTLSNLLSEKNSPNVISNASHI